jgi:hypothetical protein
MKFLLFLLAQALLYYIACRLLTGKQEHAPGILRLLVVVFLMILVERFFGWALGHGWLTGFLILVINFFILWAGLGIGLARTILAAIIVFLLNLLFAEIFASGSHFHHLASLACFPFCLGDASKGCSGPAPISGLQHARKLDYLTS